MSPLSLTHKIALALGLSFAITGCVAETAEPTDAGSTERGPLGKADAPGSCLADDGTDHCGGKSDGACWCDDLCEGYGDCCDDYQEQCSEPVDVCEEIVEAYVAETTEIRSCTQDAECGQVLTGTSCGCTRNWVARTDADISEWESIREDAFENGCEIGGISTCDCPAADGFRCNAGTCTWNYL